MGRLEIEDEIGTVTAHVVVEVDAQFDTGHGHRSPQQVGKKPAGKQQLEEGKGERPLSHLTLF